MNKHCYIYLRIFLLALMCLTVQFAWPLKRNVSEVNHALAFTAQGGYTQPFGDYTDVYFKGNSDWQAHLSYKMSFRHLLLQIGTGIEYSKANLTAGEYNSSLHTYDTQGTDFTYYYHFYNRRDDAFSIGLSIPVLLGGQFSHFYFLAGMVGSFSFYQRYNATANLTSWGTYDRYFSDFTQMDNHAFYTDEPVRGTSSTAYLWRVFQVSPHLEFGAAISNTGFTQVGYRSSREQDVTFRVAAFAEYGLLNAQQHPRYESPYIINPAEPFNVNAILIPPVLNTQHYSGQYFSNLTVGIKLTVAFHLHTNSSRCVTCTP